MFRDKKRHLNLYNIAKQERVTLLNYSGYVQWVPGSDVVVAQSRDNLCVRYSINTPDRVSMFPIKGERERGQRGSQAETAGKLQGWYMEGGRGLISPLPPSSLRRAHGH